MRGANNYAVSSITWLENDLFCMVYTPNAAEDDMGQNPASSYYIITRRKGAPFLTQKLPDLCSTMGFAMNRSPAYNFVVRLRDYKPALRDVLIVSSTASTDIGLIIRSDKPLSSEEGAQDIVGQFATTEVNDDIKRASVPLKDSVDETSVIGFSADLTCGEKVPHPLYGEDLNESSTPLPGIFLLNNDGILSSWWFIYSDAVRQKVPYSGLATVSQPPMASSQIQTTTPASAPAPAQQQPAFGQSSFGAPSALGSSGFGTPSALGSSTAAKPSGGASFGSPSAMGASTMGATAFGKPSFGSPSQIGGSTSGFGKPSTTGPSFGTPSQPGVGFGTTNTPGQPAFGQSGFGQSGSDAASGFGKPSTPGKSLLGTGSGTTGGGFGAFSSGGGGFGGLAASKPSESPFGNAKPASRSPFAASNPSPFGAKTQTDTAFPPANGVKNPFGGGNTSSGSGFVLGSSFKADNTASRDEVNEQKIEKKSSGAFSFGTALDDMVSTPKKTSPQPESMDDAEDSSTTEPSTKSESTSVFSQPTAPTNSVFGKPTQPTSGFGQPTPPTSGFGKPSTPPSLFGKPSTSTSGGMFGKPTEPQPAGAKPATSTETTKSSFSFGSNTTAQTTTQSQSTSQNQITSPISAQSDKTATPKREDSASTPTFSSSFDAPLPPDPTSRDSYAAGDTSASSNVSKSSVDDAPLPPDFTAPKKSASQEEDAPLPPDFLTQKKSSSKAEDAPLPPDFLSSKKSSQNDAPLPPDFLKQKKSAPEAEDAPLPPDFTAKPVKKAEGASLPSNFFGNPKKAEAAAEEAPLPPDFTKPKSQAKPAAESAPLPDDSDADSEEDEDESDFTDSGEEITHDETKLPSPKPSIESSFGGLSDKSSTGGFFSGFSKNSQKQAPSTLFGEIPKQPLLPPPGPAARTGREPFRSPSPTRVSTSNSKLLKSKPSAPAAGSALHARKASLTHLAQQRGGHQRKTSEAAREEQLRAHLAAQQRQEDEEALSLSDDDEDEKLRADLRRPVEPVATLDPFLPHQNYMGETAKPGVPGMIERLYRDINSMVDTLGINARSLESYLLYQKSSQTTDSKKLVNILKSEYPADVLDEELCLQDISKLDEAVLALVGSLNDQHVQGVEEKLDQCRKLMTKDIVTLYGQCASIRKTLDAHTDTGAILAAPLSAEHAALQHDLRSTFTVIQTKMTELEQGVSLLRAKIADIPRADGDSRQSKRPTVEAVTKTIATMMSMAENKSSDIDVLEAQMRKLGVEVSNAPVSREGSPFSTPRKNTGRFPTTPGSRGSLDNSAYHTPESASRGGLNFRASINGSAKHSRLRSVENIAPVVAQEEGTRWRIKNQRRQHLVGNLKKAIEKKEIKVRTMDDL